jgi:hypothetical protein
VAQVVEYLPSKREALSPKPSTDKKNVPFITLIQVPAR